MSNVKKDCKLKNSTTKKCTDIKDCPCMGMQLLDYSVWLSKLLDFLKNPNTDARTITRQWDFVDYNSLFCGWT